MLPETWVDASRRRDNGSGDELDRVVASCQLPFVMSSAARLRFVTVVPLFSPPFILSLRSLQWLDHRRSSLVPVATPQCRALHLYKTAKAKTTLGMHKVLPNAHYDPPPLEKYQH